jgi:hypothetical protein
MRIGELGRGRDRRHGGARRHRGRIAQVRRPLPLAGPLTALGARVGPEPTGITGCAEHAGIPGSVEPARVTERSELTRVTASIESAGAAQAVELARVTGTVEAARVTDSAELARVTGTVKPARVTGTVKPARVTHAVEAARVTPNARYVELVAGNFPESLRASATRPRLPGYPRVGRLRRPRA